MEGRQRRHLFTDTEVAIPDRLVPSPAAHVGVLACALLSARLSGGGEERHDEGFGERCQLCGHSHPASQVGFEGRLILVTGLRGGELAGDFGHDLAVGRSVAGRIVETSGLHEEDLRTVVEETLQTTFPGSISIGLLDVSK